MALTKTPAMVLQELCVKKHFAAPTYEIIHALTGTHSNRFDYQVTVDRVVGIGTGSSKQISKHEAALDALAQLEQIGIYDPKEMPVQEFKPTVTHNSNTNTCPTSVPSSSSPYKSSPNCIGPLKDLCFENKIPDPKFVMINEDGPPHSKEFSFECCVASLKTIATSTTKKLAKQLAAQEMLVKLKAVLPEIAAACSEMANADLPAISELDDEILKRYNATYGSIVANKTCLIEEYPYTLKKLMDKQEKSFDEFYRDIELRNDEALGRILNKLEVEYEFLEMQQKPPMIALILKIDTPFTTIGIGSSLSTAKSDAVDQAFKIMKCFMTIDN